MKQGTVDCIVLFNFAAEEVNVCELKEDPGPCKDYSERYYFDSKSKECSTFMFGGCGGNGNSFMSKEECQNECLNKNQTDHKRVITRFGILYNVFE